MFAGSRASEFALRTEGASYQEIAERGGGILNTVQSVRAAGKKELKRSTARILSEMLQQGTSTVEIKSGYGLDMDAEIKMLEAINELGNEELISVVPTFLGAHAVPPEFHDDPGAYLDILCRRMIPYVGKKKLAAFCDVFCEQGYFGLQESEQVLRAGRQWGMSLKVHADEMTPLGGAELAARLGAISADHLECVSDNGIARLAEAGVVAGRLCARPETDRCRRPRRDRERFQPRFLHVVLHAPDDDHRLHPGADDAGGGPGCRDAPRGGCARDRRRGRQYRSREARRPAYCGDT
jgi:imidazolonepropionase